MSSAAHPARIVGLDGLRGLAVFAVVGYHLDLPGVFDAGFLGVDIFFAISGFIITLGLLREYERRGDIELRAFYFRRMRRLFPAALVLVFGAAAVTLWLFPDAAPRVQADIPAAFAYLSNWWQIASKQSYFEHMGRPPVLQHLWSLAVEEQFYIVWPWVLLLLLRGRRMSTVAWGSVLLALASTVWMAQVYARPDQNRAYLGSDTHAMGLLIGAALGALCCRARWDEGALRRNDPRAAAAVQLAGWLALASLAVQVWHCNQDTPLLFQGGFLLAAVLSAVVVLASLDAHGSVSRLLATAPIQWLGTRSYSIYLWHWPIFVWLPNTPDAPHGLWWLVAVKLAATALASELSWQWLEGRMMSRSASEASRLGPYLVWCYLAVGVMFAVVRWDVRQTPAATLAVAQQPAAMVPQATGPEATVPEPAGLEAAVPEAAPPVASSASAAVPPEAPAEQPALKLASGSDITVIGDSVMLGAKEYLLRALPGIHIDAVVGRQFSESRQLLAQLRERRLLKPIVVLHLGTNGYIYEAHLRDALNKLADRAQVLLVDVHAFRRWTEQNNEMIWRVAGEHANVALVRWSAVSQDHQEYFVQDGIHLTPAGIMALTRAIGDAAGLRIPAPARPLAQRAAVKPVAPPSAPMDAASAPAETEPAAPPQQAHHEKGHQEGEQEGKDEPASEAEIP